MLDEKCLPREGPDLPKDRIIGEPDAIPEVDRAMRGLVGVDPSDVDMSSEDEPVVEENRVMFGTAGDEDGMEKMRTMFGPSQIDHLIRQAIQFCWMGLPSDRRNIDELERQIRRLVDRALRDTREDFDEFNDSPPNN